MKHTFPAITFGFITAALLLFVTSCQKINDPTELGGGLIPPVDNVNTFDTVLDVEVYNHLFTEATDSTVYSAGLPHYLGEINNDPLFGKTKSNLFFELKPSSYRYSFINKPDSLHLDSIVLVLDYIGTYGDTLQPQTVKVYEIDQASDFRADSSYSLFGNSFTYSNLLGTRTFTPSTLKDSVKVFQDTTARQLRIRLNDSFGQRLLHYDSTAGGPYSTDSAFRTYFKGFALESTGGNALVGLDLTGANTKLAIYYRDDNGDAVKQDTTVAYFGFTSRSANAMYVQRDRTGTPFAAAIDAATPSSYAYIQSVPGSFAWLKIPGLAAMSNRLVYKAELIMEQVHDASDALMFPPGRLYVDAYSGGTDQKYYTVPFDMLPLSSGGFDINSFGTLPVKEKDAASNDIYVWRINLSRYVQNIVNDRIPAYDLRLYAPVYEFNYFKATPAAESSKVRIDILDPAVIGRLRLGGYQHPAQKMRLRVIYSKL